MGSHLYTGTASDFPHWLNTLSQRVLHYGVVSWVLVALIGQWLFAAYIMLMYGRPLLSGTPDQVDTSHAITGYVVGDTLGNMMLFSHLIPAAILSFSGILQVLPVVRRRWPVFHRWNGRTFLLLGFLGALTGLYLTWLRGSRLSDIGAIGITINGLLIPVAVYFTYKYARLRRFDIHQRWAIHCFLLVNGVWTFRLYLMGWYLVNQGPNGNSATLDGPADMFFSFACYALPMLVAEAVFWARRQTQLTRVAPVALLTVVGALVTAVGVFAVTMMMWLPRMTKVLGLA